MSLKMSDLVPFETTSAFNALRRSRPASRGRFAPTRRDFLKTAVAAGTGVGLASFGFLRFPKPAFAQHGDWSIKPDCSGLTYAQDDDCEGCDLPDSPACCCASDGFYDGSTCFRKHRPDECQTGTGYDGWKWQTGLCCFISSTNCRTNRKWRCSDGWKRSDCDISYNRMTDLRICRWVLQAGDPCGCPG